jgi:selenocysteine-specific translation elongation factor
MVAVLGVQDYSNTIAKRGTFTDIALYNLKRDIHTVTLVEPVRYPERLAPLFFAVSEVDKAIVVVDDLNSTLGEILVILQCCGIRNGIFILRNYLTEEKFRPLIDGTILAEYEFLSDDPNVLREKLLQEAEEQKSVEMPTGTVPVDHAFNVKGVGTVILGVVTNGNVKKHDLVDVLPTEQKSQIRSIQKHDDEFGSAGKGDRVGLSLKGIGVEDVERGTVLSNDPAIKVSKVVKGQASLIKYWPSPIKNGMVLHIGHWMQFLNCKVETVTDEGDWRKPDLTLALEKGLVHYPNENAVLMYLEGGKLRVIGTINLP